MRAAVICGGNPDTSDEVRAYVSAADLIISCDAGAKLCKALGVKPHIMAGDFDSAGEELVKELENSGVEIIRVPREKDFTDSELGLRLAVEMGADDITLIGCIGTRLDHTLANFHLLMIPLKAGVTARLVDSHNTVYLIDDKISLNVEKNRLLSLIPLTTTVKGVTTKGLYYALNNAELTVGNSLGISNVSTEEKVEVKIKEGLLLVILSKD